MLPFEELFEQNNCCWNLVFILAQLADKHTELNRCLHYFQCDWTLCYAHPPPSWLAFLPWHVVTARDSEDTGNVYSWRARGVQTCASGQCSGGGRGGTLGGWSVESGVSGRHSSDGLTRYKKALETHARRARVSSAPTCLGSGCTSFINIPVISGRGTSPPSGVSEMQSDFLCLTFKIK